MTVALNTGSPESTTTTAAPEGHDAAMIAKAEGQVTAPAATTEAPAERPAWLPEKFKTVEELAASYTELEKKIGGGEKPAEKPAATSTEIPKPDAARAQVEGAGLDFDAVSAEFTKDGKLSDATYETLAKGGINRAVADQYIAGQQALANQTRGQVFSAAGGEEAYTEIVSWAKDALDGADIDAYNAVMSSGNINSMKLAVEGLRARFTAANGSAPKLVGGGSGHGGQAQGDVFRSNAELTTAMKDPRYATDPAYRKDVADKLGRSSIM